MTKVLFSSHSPTDPPIFLASMDPPPTPGPADVSKSNVRVSFSARFAQPPTSLSLVSATPAMLVLGGRSVFSFCSNDFSFWGTALPALAGPRALRLGPLPDVVHLLSKLYVPITPERTLVKALTLESSSPWSALGGPSHGTYSCSFLDRFRTVLQHV